MQHLDIWKISKLAGPPIWKHAIYFETKAVHFLSILVQPQPQVPNHTYMSSLEEFCRLLFFAKQGQDMLSFTNRISPSRPDLHWWSQRSDRHTLPQVCLLPVT